MKEKLLLLPKLSYRFLLYYSEIFSEQSVTVFFFSIVDDSVLSKVSIFCLG